MKESTIKFRSIKKALSTVNSVLEYAECNYANLAHFCRTELTGAFKMPMLIRYELDTQERPTLDYISRARKECIQAIDELTAMKLSLEKEAISNNRKSHCKQSRGTRKTKQGELNQ